MESYILFDHQKKSTAYANALAGKYRALSRLDPGYKRAKFVLSDNDVLTRAGRLDVLYREGLRNFFIYPHAGRPSLVNAFYKPWERTTATFAATEDHIEVMRRAGSKGNIHAVGWSLCPVREFQARTQIKNVIFAPIHPRNSKIDKKVNQATFEKLVAQMERMDFFLTVRFLAPFDGNGIKLYDHPCVNYVEGAAGPDWKQIDNADLVVSHQTFAMLAVARGIPTLMMGEDVTPHVEYRSGEHLEARDWDDYKDLIMYPLDILQSADTPALMTEAAQDDSKIVDWKRRMIGDPFDGNKFVQILEKYL